MRRKQNTEFSLFQEFLKQLWVRVCRAEDLWLAGPVVGITGWISFQLLAVAAPYIASLFAFFGWALFVVGILKLISDGLNRLFGTPRRNYRD